MRFIQTNCKGVSDVMREVAGQDRRLVTMDSPPPLWQASPGHTGAVNPDCCNLEIETAFARDFDAALHARRTGLGVFALLLLPAIFWLRRRARRWSPPASW